MGAKKGEKSWSERLDVEEAAVLDPAQLQRHERLTPQQEIDKLNEVLSLPPYVDQDKHVREQQKLLLQMHEMRLELLKTKKELLGYKLREVEEELQKLQPQQKETK